MATLGQSADPEPKIMYFPPEVLTDKTVEEFITLWMARVWDSPKGPETHVHVEFHTSFKEF